ncbi:Uncharacterized conserved protein [Cribrihabitans marinus]|uniref:Uncharacterized conserved protein n=1 Tax=Cribrihabitans marinus TaxID=1227549 RepID=A0A1H7BUF7_9RHOB|nr:GFA family protein [Cribrihabitans marinus]GGH33714.1 aldehyde-activating protein [Cribrihabitans marinus]SEJ80654.1 Uncharacterized conserved protein [Cribrihabitans marinus]
MAHPDFPLTGSCRCGGVTIEVSAPPMLTAVCHCKGCQRMSSSAYSLTAIFPAPAFSVTGGTPVIAGAKGPEQHHYHCPDCMSWMFTRIESVDAIVNVRPTMFDDAAWVTPFIETMTRDKLPWVQVPARHSFEEFPSMDEFQALAAEFAGQS